jgi:histone-lysine N-methyltransferase SETMAR
MAAVDIYGGMTATLGPDAIGYSTITRYLRETRFSPSTQTTPVTNAETDLDDCDRAILWALDEQPFASIRQIARLTHLPRSTVHRRLTRSLGFLVHHLRWVPHLWSQSQKENRARLSRELLTILQQQQQRSWHDIVTLDESWFYLNTDHELIWLQPDAEIPERERHTVQSEKVMLTVVWNPSGWHVVTILPKGATFDAAYYISDILTPLAKWRKNQIGSTNRNLIVHSDNARPHIAKKNLEFLKDNSMNRAPHPAHSPDLAPSDFYLFGYIKQVLAGTQFDDRAQLFMRIDGILEGIQKVTLEKVFSDWMERLEQCIQIAGNYVE